MTYNDANAYFEHFQEIKEGLTDTAKAILQYLAHNAQPTSGEWYVSHKRLAIYLGYSERSTKYATAELIEKGLVTRTRPRRDKQYIYTYLLACPEECRDPKHKTPERVVQNLHLRRTQELVQDLHNPSGKSCTSPSAESAQLNKKGKETKKGGENLPPSLACKRCTGYRSPDPLGVIHREDCPQLQTLRTSTAWSITAEQSGATWELLDSETQQLKHLESMRQGKERKRNQEQEQANQQQAKADKLERVLRTTLINSNLPDFLPNLRTYLEIRYRERGGDLDDSSLNRAVDYTKRGTDLPDQGEWRTGRVISAEDFTGSMAKGSGYALAE